VSAPDTPIYQPFPPFAEWAGVAVDVSTFDHYAALLDDLRARPDSALARAVEVATRAAAIDTGAIEGLYEVDRGFTYTVARGVAAWEKVLAEREPVVRRSFEDALRAYDFVLDLATTRTDVSEKAIREIHHLICAGQDTYRVLTSAGWQERPLPKGEYKDTPNNPTSRRTGEVHAYAPPIDVPAEMRRLVEELRSAAFTAAHSVLQAAYAHYAFVAVHPFPDGNGRVARALASVYLYRRPGVPLVIFADQKDAYLNGLEEADEGRPEPFVRFVQERVADVVGLVQVAVRGPAQPADLSMVSLRDAMVGQDGLEHRELDAIAGRLMAAADAELHRRVQALELAEGVKMEPLSVHHSVGTEDGYRQAPGLDTMQGIGLAAGPPANVFAPVEIGVRVRRPDARGPLFRLVSMPSQASLPVELREVFPTFSAVLELKLEYWVEGLVDRMAADLDRKTRQALREKGYL
jgi:Fic family protein